MKDNRVIWSTTPTKTTLRDDVVYSLPGSHRFFMFSANPITSHIRFIFNFTLEEVEEFESAGWISSRGEFDETLVDAFVKSRDHTKKPCIGGWAVSLRSVPTFRFGGRGDQVLDIKDLVEVYFIGGCIEKIRTKRYKNFKIRTR